MTMGVDHGGRGDKPPPHNLEWGTLVQIVPLRFLSYRYQKGAFCGLQNTRKIRFRPWLCPGPRWGAHDAPQTPSRLESGHPSPYLTPFGTDPPSALAMRPPQNSSQIYAYDDDFIINGDHLHAATVTETTTRYNSPFTTPAAVMMMIATFEILFSRYRPTTQINTTIARSSEEPRAAVEQRDRPAPPTTTHQASDSFITRAS